MGKTASLRSACEQDGVKYINVMQLMNKYPVLRSNPKSAFSYTKLSKDAKIQFKRNIFAKAIGESF